MKQITQIFWEGESPTIKKVHGERVEVKLVLKRL